MSNITSAAETYLNAYRVKGFKDIKYLDSSNLASAECKHFEKIVCARTVAEVQQILSTLWSDDPTFVITETELVGMGVIMETSESEKHNGNLAF